MTSKNRGPAAAVENRAALIQAAREIFAEQGVDAPLSAIAKRAKVGQGSLYRHFPTRGAIAVAAFDANVNEIEALVASGGHSRKYSNSSKNRRSVRLRCST